LGAGASKTFGIPTTIEMADKFGQGLVGQDRTLFNLIVNNLRHYRDFDVEALITLLERIRNIDRLIEELNNPSLHFFLGNLTYSYPNTIEGIRGEANRLKEEAENLLKKLKGFIRDVCAQKIEEEKFSLLDMLFAALLDKEGISFKTKLQDRGEKAAYYEIFTTNYDMILERYCRSRNLLYESGEMRDRRVDISSRNTQLYGASTSCFKIFKLHGSINWGEVKERKIMASDMPVKPGGSTIYGESFTKEMVIYPIREFYTFREPFYDMFHHLKTRLTASNRCCIIGYSFRDPDIAGLFLDAAELKEKIKFYFIDPKVDEIVNRRLTRIDGQITKIDKEFGYEAIDELTEHLTKE
jgi:hypothetical protein